MLKKLKFRLILHNMLVLVLVFSLLFAAFCAFIYIREESKITSALKDNVAEAKLLFSSSDAEPINTDNQKYDVSFSPDGYDL